MKSVELDIVIYDLQMLADTAHIMSVGFEAYNNQLGKGCMQTIENSIDQLISKYKSEVEEAE